MTIPVEIKVMDFALPQPKAYFDPEMDFWVCFYNYITLGYCQVYNVGHHDVYLAYGDEPSVPNLTSRHRAAEKAGQANGFKYILACGPHAFAKNAHLAHGDVPVHRRAACGHGNGEMNKSAFCP